MSRRHSIAVTGSSGFVGAHIVRVLVGAGLRVIGLDVGEPPPEAQPSEFIQCDITDRALFDGAVARQPIEAFVHAAAITPGPEERERAYEVLQVNYLSTATALTAAAAAGYSRFIYMSSAGVYADPPAGEDLDERAPLDETGGLYAQSKIASERLCVWASRELGLSTVALRVGPVYGEFERPTASRAVMSPVYRALELKQRGHDVAADHPGSAYNLIYGDDLGRAVLAALDADASGPVYNVGGPLVAVHDLLVLVANLDLDVQVPSAPRDSPEALAVAPRPRPLDSGLIHRELGFQPRSDLDSGLNRTVHALRSSG